MIIYVLVASWDHLLQLYSMKQIIVDELSWVGVLVSISKMVSFLIPCPNRKQREYQKWNKIFCKNDI